VDRQTPKVQAFRMPAEWEPHNGTWMLWHYEDTHQYSQLHLEQLWPGKLWVFRPGLMLNGEA